MVYFAPHVDSHVGPRLLVREQIRLADAYRRAADVPVREPFDDDYARGPVFDDADAPAPVPDPFDDADALEELEEEIATLAAHIHAATHRLLTLIAEFDRRRGWELGGHSSCAYWLSARTGIDLGAAREKVRTAQALVALPETSASMSRGELSFSKIRALSRVATKDNEGDLLELARGCTTAQLERMVRGFRRGSREDEAALERRRHESRTLSVFPDDDGMYAVKGRLPAEVGALLMRAMEAASDALYRENRVPRLKAETEAERQRAAAQRRADALGLLAERALAAGFGGRDRAGQGAENEEEAEPGAESDAQPGAGSDAQPGAGDNADEQIPISGTRAERYQVVLHVEPETLSAEGEPGRSELEDGTNVAPARGSAVSRAAIRARTARSSPWPLGSAETSRRLSCDAGLVRVSHAPDGSILNVGRRTRTISPALRRALEARDQGCRFPGCGLRFAEAHHVTHWADGGETSLSNTLLACRHHHRLLHEGGWQVGWWGPGRAVFFDPRGGTHFDGRWQQPELGEHPVEALVEQNRLRGVSPDGWTAGVRWKREDDIPDQIYFRALEAMDEAKL